MKVKMAQQMQFYLCGDCSAVHVAFYRNGKIFAEAIPNNPEEMLAELAACIEESKALRGAAGVILPKVRH